MPPGRLWKDLNWGGRIVLFCGLLFFVGPFAWAAGAKYERECRALGVEPESSGKTGKILGMIATVLIGVGLLAIGALLLMGVIASASR